jgi:hypothetical protein
MSAYDVVRQHTMLYVSIRYRTSAYYVVRQHTISHTICNMLETTWVLCGGWGSHTEERAGFSGTAARGFLRFPHRRACRLFWHCCSRFPFAILDVISAQRARAQAGAHACRSRCGGARQGRVHTCDAILHRSRKSHHLSHDRVIATNDWSSARNVEQLRL